MEERRGKLRVIGNRLVAERLVTQHSVQMLMMVQPYIDMGVTPVLNIRLT